MDYFFRNRVRFQRSWCDLNWSIRHTLRTKHGFSLQKAILLLCCSMIRALKHITRIWKGCGSKKMKELECSPFFIQSWPSFLAKQDILSFIFWVATINGWMLWSINQLRSNSDTWHRGSQVQIPEMHRIQDSRLLNSLSDYWCRCLSWLNQEKLSGNLI